MVDCFRVGEGEGEGLPARGQTLDHMHSTLTLMQVNESTEAQWKEPDTVCPCSLWDCARDSGFSNSD